MTDTTSPAATDTTTAAATHTAGAASSAQWSAIGTTARVVVTAPESLESARRIVVDELAALDLACSRFRPDSETSRLAQPGGGGWTPISALLTELLAVSLDVAATTAGDVDPTLGSDLCLLGYDRDFSEIHAAMTEPATPYRIVRRPTWRDVELDVDGRRVRVPEDVVLDLGAIAKAWCADRCARRIDREFGGAVGVLVSLGGDIATAGPGPDGGWLVAVQDRPDATPGATDAPTSTIALTEGFALATSSTITRTWQRGAASLHHILDPTTRRPAVPIWRTVSVAAGSCVQANAATTAAVVRGMEALPWLASLGLPARLVARSGEIRTLGGWPTQGGAAR